MTKTEKEHLKGTVTRFSDNRGDITADDGDWYEFKSKRSFREGDRVSFDVLQSDENFSLALMGGPINCINVKRLMGDQGMGKPDVLSGNPNDKVNIIITYGSPGTDSDINH